jgi:outer membrane protein assembly factor BamA
LLVAGGLSGAGAAGVTPSAPAELCALYRIERVIVVGNTLTAEAVIRAELLLSEGDTFDDSKARLSRLRLLSIGFFSDVRMRLERGSRRGWVFWIIEVKERGNLLLNTLFFGISEENDPFGGLSWSHRNLDGTGQTVTLSLALARAAGKAVRFDWTDPYLLGPSAMFEASAYWNETEDRFRGDFRGLRIRYNRLGARARFGWRRRPLSRLYLDLRLERVREEDRTIGDWGGSYSFPAQQTWLSALGVEMSWDRRNDFFLPTSGYHLSARIEFSAPAVGSDYRFTRFRAQYEQYLSTGGSRYFRFRGEWGMVAGDPPHFEMFYSSQAVRGRRYPPFLGLSFEEENPRDSLAAVGVEHHWGYFSKETGFLYQAEVYVFLDAGMAFDRADRDTYDFEAAAGPGLVFDTDIGLIKLAFGFFL